MSEFEGDGMAEFNIEDLNGQEIETLKAALKAGKGGITLYAYVYLEIEQGAP